MLHPVLPHAPADADGCVRSNAAARLPPFRGDALPPGATAHTFQLDGPEPFDGFSFTSPPAYHNQGQDIYGDGAIHGGPPAAPKAWVLTCDGAVISSEAQINFHNNGNVGTWPTWDHWDYGLHGYRMCNDFDIISVVHVSRISRPHPTPPTPHAPCGMVYLAPMLSGC